MKRLFNFSFSRKMRNNKKQGTGLKTVPTCSYCGLEYEEIRVKSTANNPPSTSWIPTCNCQHKESTSSHVSREDEA